ncbi:unnamed protein product [Paramecium sonneborni]|uniref:Protein kinase domain-containing protein n=1 Tax=Paramecium sonneborni TaxID=65129 RepID=A0A8S1LKI2_9CILI|nr:unnamed protein product [Paramecium sonneborni]
MGNTEGNAGIKELHANYIQIRNIKDDARYGEGRIVKQKQTKEESFQKEMNLTDEDKFKKVKIMLEKKQNNKYDNIINVTKLYYQEDSQFCGQFYKIYILLEYIPLCLYDIIEQRLAKKQQLKESELWPILTGCIEGLFILQSQNISHQSIRPETISYMEQYPYVKLSDPTVSGVLSSFQQVVQDELKQINQNYLSPQLMQSLNDQIQPQHNPYKSDVYSLGMTMLYLSTLNNCDDCYDLSRSKVIHQQVQRRLQQMEQSFSTQYVQILRNMLLLNEEQRPDFIQLKQEFQGISIPHSLQKQYHEEEEIIQSKQVPIIQVESYQQAVESFSIQQPQTPQVVMYSESSAKFNIQQSNQSIPNTSIQRSQQQLKISQQTNQSIYVDRNGVQDLRPDIYDHIKILPLSEQISFPSEIDHNIGNQIGMDQFLDITNEPEPDDNYNNNLMPTTSFETSQQYQQQYQQMQQSKSNNLPVSYDSYNVDYNQTNNLSNQKKYDYLYDRNLSNQEKLINYQNDLKKTFEHLSIKPEKVIEVYGNGSKYEGEKLNGLRHGNGTFFYQDNGGVYEGQWFENKMHGMGTLFYASGKPAYEGQWVNDKFEGKGTLYNEEPQSLFTEFDYRDFDQVGEFWTKYVGLFHDDNKEGQGTLYLSNGDKFEGNFLQDLVSGPGKYIKSNGQFVSGRWWRNKLQQ